MNVLNRMLLMACLAAAMPWARAEMDIEITEGIESALPIAVVPFAVQGGVAPVSISDVVNSDLGRSGYFRTLSEQQMPARPSSAAEVQFEPWKSLGQNYLVVGQVTPMGGQFNIQFQLLDVNNGAQLLGYRMSAPAANLRRTAHQISDLIFEKLIGKKGVFSGRIAYITSSGQGRQRTHKLQVADADGFNPQTIATSPEPIMSPAWSPDGGKMAYVSFERKTAAIYIQTLATGQREKIAEFPGINGAPAWSPDGTRLALTLSKDGSPDIYVLNLVTQGLTKLTRSFAIDTEPAWSPDGSSIVFTSDRGGKPQLYIMSSQGGNEKRLTFSGDYNARASFSPDGKSIAMVHGNGGDYRIAVMDISNRSINVLTSGPTDESPSFAPNGNMILYASQRGSGGFLAAVSVDGQMQQKLVFDSNAVREPAWSP